MFGLRFHFCIGSTTSSPVTRCVRSRPSWIEYVHRKICSETTMAAVTSCFYAPRRSGVALDDLVGMWQRRPSSKDKMNPSTVAGLCLHGRQVWQRPIGSVTGLHDVRTSHDTHYTNHLARMSGSNGRLSEYWRATSRDVNSTQRRYV